MTRGPRAAQVVASVLDAMATAREIRQRQTEGDETFRLSANPRRLTAVGVQSFCQPFGNPARVHSSNRGVPTLSRATADQTLAMLNLRHQA